tara:strand:- start:289 stop:513 length:225 start_codon:yes stop_codon:yes gene_type:complete
MSRPGKKVTYKELDDRMTIFFNRLMEVHQNMDYVHTLIMKYIKFSGNEPEFLKFVEKERDAEEKKARENDSKSK